MHSTISCLSISYFKFHAFYEYLYCLSHVSCFMHSTSILSACLMSHVSCIRRVSCLPVSCFMFYAFYDYLVCLSHVSCFMHSTSILSACLPATQLLNWSFSLISVYCSPMVILSPPVVTLLILVFLAVGCLSPVPYYSINIPTSKKRLAVSLGSDIPAGDGNAANIFLQCICLNPLL
jgi:hypothetical protein